MHLSSIKVIEMGKHSRSNRLETGFECVPGLVKFLNSLTIPRGNRDMFLTKCGYNRICPFVIPTISFLCPNFIYQI